MQLKRNKKKKKMRDKNPNKKIEKETIKYLNIPKKTEKGFIYFFIMNQALENSRR